MIIDILQSQLAKLSFESSETTYTSTDLSHDYIRLISELMHHLYMVSDFINLFKVLTNFKYTSIRDVLLYYYIF